MTLWTIQPEEVYQQIQKTDIYRCDFEKSQMTDLREQYDWLVQEMKARTGSQKSALEKRMEGRSVRLHGN